MNSKEEAEATLAAGSSEVDAKQAKRLEIKK